MGIPRARTFIECAKCDSKQFAGFTMGVRHTVTHQVAECAACFHSRMDEADKEIAEHFAKERKPSDPERELGRVFAQLVDERMRKEKC